MSGNILVVKIWQRERMPMTFSGERSGMLLKTGQPSTKKKRPKVSVVLLLRMLYVLLFYVHHPCQHIYLIPFNGLVQYMCLCLVQYMCLSQSVQAAVTEYHTLSDLTNIYFSYIWRLGSQGIRCWQIWFLVRALFLICRGPSSYSIQTWPKERKQILSCLFVEWHSSQHRASNLIS